MKDMFDFFGDVGTEVVDAVQNKPWPFWHVHDLVRLHNVRDQGRQQHLRPL